MVNAIAHPGVVRPALAALLAFVVGLAVGLVVR